MALEVYANVPAAQVVSGGADAPAPGTVQTWIVSSSAEFQAASASAAPPTQFHVGDPDASTEMILVTNMVGTTWTVTRGDEGSTPVAHAAGFTVTQVVTKGALAQASRVDWLNPVTMFGADGTGASDSTSALNMAIGAVPAGGGVIYLNAGTYSVNSGSALALTVAGTKLLSAGGGPAVISYGPSFTGGTVIAVQADSCEISGVTVAGASATLTSNPAATGVGISGGFQHTRLSALTFSHVNGWAIQSVAGTARANLDTMIDAPLIRNCAGGIDIEGASGSGFSAEHFLTDIQMQQMGASSGSAASLDALRLKDCQDVLTENINVGLSAGNGSAVHILGACASNSFTNADLGGGNAVVLIEDSGGNSPTGIEFVNGEIQESTAGPGLKVTGAGGDHSFAQMYFHRNTADGLQASNTGNASQVLNCRWNTTNQAGTTAYDINLAGASAPWIFTGGVLESAVGTITAGKVTNPVNDPNGVGVFHGTSFLGGSTTAANLAPGGQALALWFCTVTSAQGIGPMTTLGDLIYGAASGAATRLAGNTASQKEFLQSLGSGGNAAAPSWATVPGQFLCSPSAYQGTGAQTLMTTTSGTMSAVSSANVNTGSFVAPATGNVVVESAFVMQAAPNASALGFGLAAHGTSAPMAGADTVWKEPATTQPFPHVVKSVVTGLTPGTSYNFDLMFAVAAGGTVTVFANAQSGTAPSLSNSGVGSPVIMTVQAI